MSGKPKHGLSRTPEYRAWGDMRQRCFNRHNVYFSSYGGRGITVCQSWCDSFVAFLHDVGHRPTQRHQIERINNDGSYTPDNCRWALPKEQQNNKTNSVLLAAFGKTMTLALWAETIGIKRQTIESRLRYGWTNEQALSMPVPSWNAHPRESTCK